MNGNPMKNATWLMMDYEAGECDLSQVGSPKVSIDDGVATDAADLSLIPSERLKVDAMTAYNSLGGPEYLRRNPDRLDKVLLKMVAEPDKRVDSNVTVTVHAPWMLPTRLAYLDAIPANEPTPALDNTTHTPWRVPEPEPQPLVSAQRILPPTLGDPNPSERTSPAASIKAP
jgi:hypothetical protein